jgi:hypothetical protein
MKNLVLTSVIHVLGTHLMKVARVWELVNVYIPNLYTDMELLSTSIVEDFNYIR